MEPYRPLTLRERPERCPICGGEVWTILYGEPTPEAYEQRHETKTIFGGCCITEHDPTWQCFDCHTPIYEGDGEGGPTHMAYATCIIYHEELLPITQTVIHIAYDTARNKYAAEGFIRTYYGDNTDEYPLHIDKAQVRQFFSADNMKDLEQAANITELPPILDGATMWLRVEGHGNVYIIERNSANVDIDDSMTLFLLQMRKLHTRWRREDCYGELL